MLITFFSFSLAALQKKDIWLFHTRWSYNTHTAYYYNNVSNEVFGDRLKSNRLWQSFLTLIPVIFIHRET